MRIGDSGGMPAPVRIGAAAGWRGCAARTVPFLIVFAAAATLAGCRRRAPDAEILRATRPAADGRYASAGTEDGGAASARRLLADAFPRPCRISYRAIMTVVGRRFALTGLLAVGSHGSARLVALDTFGRKAFDVLLLKGDGAVPIEAGPGFDRVWIASYPARDVRCLFLTDPSGFCFEGVTPEGKIVMAKGGTGGAMAGYVVPPDGRAPVRFEIVRSGRLVYSAEMYGFRSFAGSPGLSPETVRAVSDGYSVEMTILDITAGPQPDALFEPPAAGGGGG
ncbi:MAG: hypothetical protein N3A38_14400 [Planctomycetota bacterium]|nr:hypothetical protein [Planctomycetota bacterium]